MFFALPSVKILHLDEIGICRCTAHHDGVQDGARVKSIPPTHSDLLSQKKGLILLIMIMIRMNVQIVFTFFKVRISRKP